MYAAATVRPLMAHCGCLCSRMLLPNDGALCLMSTVHFRRIERHACGPELLFVLAIIVNVGTISFDTIAPFH